MVPSSRPAQKPPRPTESRRFTSELHCSTASGLNGRLKSGTWLSVKSRFWFSSSNWIVVVLCLLFSLLVFCGFEKIGAFKWVESFCVVSLWVWVGGLVRGRGGFSATGFVRGSSGAWQFKSLSAEQWFLGSGATHPRILGLNGRLKRGPTLGKNFNKTNFVKC